ncbi:hypothetical protein AVEN_270020-1 [Araneus ventricosus]|uniref:Uncharacterized protein n=1 Tax=Araneus ventricosus TaxID=182803 RepID=A0A4Y2H361_ARAVE|nr:hypothetical protein AVEN_270020-1 [Araneus ventricosus]
METFQWLSKPQRQAHNANLVLKVPALFNASPRPDLYPKENSTQPKKEEKKVRNLLRLIKMSLRSSDDNAHCCHRIIINTKARSAKRIRNKRGLIFSVGVC